MLTSALVSPNGDGYEDITTARYVLVEPAVVSVAVQDTLGLTVSMPLIEVRQNAGARFVRIDPSVLPDGRYRVVLSARGDSGRQGKLRAELSVNRTLGWLRIDPSVLTLTPTGDSTVTISFELSGPAQVIAEVRDGGSLVGTISSEWLEAGPHAVIWNGSLPTGTMPPGVYEIWVTAGTGAGTVMQRAWLTITHPPG